MDVFNPGFETGSVTDARNIIVTNNQSSITVESSAAHAGGFGVKWNPNPVGTPPNMSLSMTPKVTGQAGAHMPSSRGTHTFGVWVKTNLAQGDHNIVLRLRAYDSAGVLLKASSYEPVATVPVSTTWTQFTVSQEPVNNTAFVEAVLEIDLLTDLNNASFLIDDVTLDRVLEPLVADLGPKADLTDNLRLEVQKARNDAFVWGVSTWTGYRWGGPTDTAASGVEWLNILGSSHEINIQRGAKRDGLTTTLDAGTLSATVFDAVVDPNTNPYIKPGTPMRLQADTAFGSYNVFTGVIRQVQVTYRGKKPTVILSAVDRVKDLANINRSGVVSGTFTERVDDLLTKHGIPNDVSGSSSLILAQNAYDSTLLNHMTLAATSEQGYFFVDKGNTVKAYGKNAALAANPSVYFTDRRITGPDRTNYVLNPSWMTSNGTAEVRRNLATNPYGIAQFGANNTTWVNTANTTVAGHPLGIVKANHITPNASVSTAIASAFNVDGLGNYGTSRGLGVWVWSSVAASVTVYLDGNNAGTTKTTAIAAGTWNYCTSNASATGNSIVIVTKTSGGNAIPTTDYCYVTGSIAEAGCVPPVFFSGDTAPTTDGLTYAWVGAAGSSASTATGLASSLGALNAYTAHGGNTGWIPAPGSYRVLTRQGLNTTNIWGFTNQNPVPAAAGEVWSGKVKVRLTSGTANAQVYLRLGAYDASPTLITSSVPGATVTLTPGGDWQDIVVNGYTAPATTATMRFLVYAANTVPAGSVLEFSQAVLEKSPTAGDYFDGDSASSAWNGVSDASTSTQWISKTVEYTDIAVAYDSNTLTNDIYVNNLTSGYDEEMNPVSISTKYGPFRNVTSIATYGAFTEEVETNLSSELDVEDFANTVLDANDAPELRIDRVTFNASRRPDRAASLEVFDTVNVEYNNENFRIGEDFSILAIEHQITAHPDEHKWLVDVDLISIGGS